MPKYNDMLRNAIRALPNNTGASRRAVYEQARSSLVNQLRAISPSLPARDVTRHRLDLENDIRQVEQENVEARLAERSVSVPRLLPRAVERPSVAIRAPPEVQSQTATKEEATSTGASVPTTSGLATKKSPPGYVVYPTVFLTPKGEQEDDFVSAMMPFSSEFNSVYRCIRTAVSNVGLRISRADSIWEDQVIIQDIFGLIFRSSVVICDFSTRNPNVLYEAGIAHTLGRSVVPIVQQLSDLPFDLRHHRVLIYDNTPKGRAKLRKELEKRLSFLKGKAE